jgi:hypothetical protein
MPLGCTSSYGLPRMGRFEKPDSVGIVGAGIAALQLALQLHRHGRPATLYVDRTPEQIRASRLPNTVCRFPPTRLRERDLGVDHWDDADLLTFAMDVSIVGTPIAFRGAFREPASFVDMRLYQARLLEDLLSSGGHVEFGAALQPADMARLARHHALVVVASGRSRLAQIFPRRADRSPLDRPRRRLFAGLFHGVAPLDPPEMVIRLVPGVGELFIAPFLSFAGRVSNVLVEAVPGGELDWITRDRSDGLEAGVLDVLRAYAPGLVDRVNVGDFRLTGPCDFHRGAITPVIRENSIQLEHGVCALAIGDAHVLNDPVVGQGANAASFAARTVGQAILEGGPFDADFCCRVQQRTWPYLRAVTEWSNASLEPPPPHVKDIFHAAAEQQEVADAIASNFADPGAAWAAFSSPEGAAMFLQRFEHARVPS